MPGLFGAVRIDPHRQLTHEQLESLLSRMAARLRHYEGYVTETHIDANAGLAVGRTGFPHHHPLAWPPPDDAGHGRHRAFIAGALRGDGLPTAPADYSAWEEHKRRVSTASGSYAAVVSAADGAATAIIADRQASQPIYYTACDGLLLFAPEVKALLEYPGTDRTLDWAALATFLASGYLLAEQSFFSAIRRLPGGSALIIEDDSFALQPYWSFRPGEAELDRPMAEYAAELGARIDAAVSRDLDDPARTVLLLSGGVDSRAILGAAYHALRRDGARINTLTWGCAPDRAGADIQIAGQIGAALALHHQTVELGMAAYAGYGATFRRVNYLLDGMSISAAIHPDKFAVTEGLYAAGFRTLLRGEQTFGFAEREYSLAGSLAKLGLRRFRDAGLLARIVQPEVYPTLAEASDRVIDRLMQEAAGIDPNDFTHRAYFRDRYQRLSGAAAYYKQVLMDHRNPLMDNAILDLIQHLPKACRDDKALLYYTVRTRYPELSPFRYANRTNLEDWAGLLANDTPVRRYALEELSDANSGIWSYLDRGALRAIVDQAGPARTTPRRESSLGNALRAHVKPLLYKGSPRLAARRRLAKSARQDVSPDKLLMRALVLKHWHDTFVRR